MIFKVRSIFKSILDHIILNSYLIGSSGNFSIYSNGLDFVMHSSNFSFDVIIGVTSSNFEFGEFSENFKREFIALIVSLNLIGLKLI